MLLVTLLNKEREIKNMKRNSSRSEHDLTSNFNYRSSANRSRQKVPTKTRLFGGYKSAQQLPPLPTISHYHGTSPEPIEVGKSRLSFSAMNINEVYASRQQPRGYLDTPETLLDSRVSLYSIGSC